VWQAILVAGGTFGKRGCLQVIVSAALSPSRIRVSSFWIRHSFTIISFFLDR
jgi:hypothetical protein